VEASTHLDLVGEQRTPAVEQIGSKEPAAAGYKGAAIIRHTATLTGIGAIRFAIAPYDCANTAPAQVSDWNRAAKVSAAGCPQLVKAGSRIPAASIGQSIELCLGFTSSAAGAAAWLAFIRRTNDATKAASQTQV
jgi:hypothetical protein